MTTDGQTPHDDIGRAYASHCVAGIYFLYFLLCECEALPGVAYPGVWDNRSTLNTKTGYDDMMMMLQSRELAITIVWKEQRQMCALKFLRLEDFLYDRRHGQAINLEPRGVLFADVSVSVRRKTHSGCGLPVVEYQTHNW